MEKTEKEILEDISELQKGNSSPYSHTAAGVYSQISASLIELQRRSSLRIEKSSKRFGGWSLVIAITAIIISIVLSI